MQFSRLRRDVIALEVMEVRHVKDEMGATAVAGEDGKNKSKFDSVVVCFLFLRVCSVQRHFLGQRIFARGKTRESKSLLLN